MTVCSHLGYPNRKRVSGTEGSQEIIRQRITSVTKENVFKRGSGGDRPNCGVGTSKRGVFILVLSEYCAPAPYPSTNCVRIPKIDKWFSPSNGAFRLLNVETTYNSRIPSDERLTLETSALASLHGDGESTVSTELIKGSSFKANLFIPQTHKTICIWITVEQFSLMFR